MKHSVSSNSTGHYSRMRSFGKTAFENIERRNQGCGVKSLLYVDIPQHKRVSRKIYSSFARFIVKRVDVFSPHIQLYRNLMQVLEEGNLRWVLPADQFSAGSELEKLLSRVLENASNGLEGELDIERFKFAIQEVFRRFLSSYFHTPNELELVAEDAMREFLNLPETSDLLLEYMSSS